MTPDGLGVDDLLDGVKRAIKMANISATDQERDLRVTSVHLTLNTVLTTTAGGRLDLRVPFIGMGLKIGRTVHRGDTHTLEVTLTPEEPASEHEIREGGMESVLVEAIETFRRVMSRARGGDDPFTLQDGTIELTFAVTDTGTISLGLDGEQKGELTHKLRLSLTPTDA